MIERGARCLYSPLVVLLLVTAACAGGEEPQARRPPAQSDDQKSGDAGNKQIGKGKRDRKTTNKPGSNASSGSSRTNDGTKATSDGGGLGNEGEAGPEYATGEDVEQEPRPDASKHGVVPEYSEALEASFTGLGDQLRMQMVFAANLPDRMPAPNTFMVVGFGVGGDADHEEDGFYVSGDNDGWKAYAGGKSNPKEFPGELEIDGRRMTLTLEWSYFGGPRSFDWQANATWGQSLGAANNYSFDQVPNDGPGHYPG